VLDEIQWRYRTDVGLGKYLNFEVGSLGGGLFTVGVPEPVCGGDEYSRFKKDVGRAEERYYAYSVTPKELVQRISDVGSRRRFNQLLLALSLSTTEAGISAVNDFLSEEQGIFHAITRQPLVVGFGNGRDAFGWLLGPKFQIDRKSKDVRGVFGFSPSQPSVNFRHAPIQNNVGAIVAVPAWWRTLTITPKVYWQDESGRRLDESGNPLGTGGAGVWNIDVPYDYAALTRALARPTYRRAPSIDSKMERVRLVAGQPASVVIRGTDLWRGTVVTIGDQRSRRITVLPNMEGIIAEFDAIRAPADWTNPREPYENAPVSVWTSEGEVSLPARAVIYSPQQGELSTRIEPVLRHVVRESMKTSVSVRVLASDVLRYPEHTRLGLRLAPLAPGDSPAWSYSGAVIVDAGGGVATAEIPLGDGDWKGVASGKEVEVGLESRRRSEAPWRRVSLPRTLTYYASPNQAKVHLKTTGMKVDPANPADLEKQEIVFELPVATGRAFPDLLAAGVPVEVSVSSDAKFKVELSRGTVSLSGAVPKVTKRLKVADGADEYQKALTSGNKQIVVNFSLNAPEGVSFPELVATSLTLKPR
jgi:hypothetical protein